MLTRPNLGRAMVPSYSHGMLMYFVAKKERLSGRPLSDDPALKELVRVKVLFPVDNKTSVVKNMILTKNYVSAAQADREPDH